MSNVIYLPEGIMMFQGTYSECVGALLDLKKAGDSEYAIIPDWDSWSKEREKIVG